MESALVENSSKDQLFAYQGKHQQATEHWLQLITQIALDYKRPIAAELQVGNSKQQESLVVLEKGEA